MSKEKALLGQIHKKRMVQVSRGNFIISKILHELIRNLDTGVSFKKFTNRSDFEDTNPYRPIGRGFIRIALLESGMDFIAMLKSRITSAVSIAGGTPSLADALLLRDTKRNFNPIFKKSSSVVGYMEYLDMIRELSRYDDVTIITKLKQMAGGTYGSV